MRVRRPAEVKVSVTEETLAKETAKDAASGEEEAVEKFEDQEVGGESDNEEQQEEAN